VTTPATIFDEIMYAENRSYGNFDYYYYYSLLVKGSSRDKRYKRQKKEA